MQPLSRLITHQPQSVARPLFHRLLERAGRQQAIFALLSTVVGLAACAGSQDTTGGGPGAGVSNRRVIAAVGQSPDSRAAALAQARAEVARQVSSRVETELFDLAGTRGRTGAAEEYQDFWQKVRVTARFEHAELIRELAYRSPDDTGGPHEVTAVMSRADADAALAADGAPIA